MNYINKNKISEYDGNNFSIKKYRNGVTFIYKTGQSYDELGYHNGVIPKLQDIKIITGNVLIGGLGVGIIPQWLSNVCPFLNIHVIDIDTELIGVVKNMNYLNNSITIYNQDIYEFIPNIIYDVIILDIWFDEGEITSDGIYDLRLRYNSYLKDNGKMYFPILPPYSYQKITN